MTKDSGKNILKSCNTYPGNYEVLLKETEEEPNKQENICVHESEDLDY